MKLIIVACLFVAVLIVQPVTADSENGPCIAPKSYVPVCGKDGQTYGNAKALQCANEERIVHGLPEIAVDYEGECRRPNTRHRY